jgi:streptomycin 6-kinase
MAAASAKVAMPRLAVWIVIRLPGQGLPATIGACWIRKARELASDGPAGLLHGDLHLSNILSAGPARGLVAIDPRPGFGDLTFDAIDWTLDRAASTDEVRERIGQLCGLVPDLDSGRLWQWCQATAAALAVLRLRHRSHDGTTQLLLKLAAGI